MSNWKWKFHARHACCVRAAQVRKGWYQSLSRYLRDKLKARIFSNTALYFVWRESISYSLQHPQAKTSQLPRTSAKSMVQLGTQNLEKKIHAGTENDAKVKAARHLTCNTNLARKFSYDWWRELELNSLGKGGLRGRGLLIITGLMWSWWLTIKMVGRLCD